MFGIEVISDRREAVSRYLHTPYSDVIPFDYMID